MLVYLELCKKLFTNKILSLDTETTSTNAIDAELVGLSFSVKENEAYYVAIPENRNEAEQFVEIFKPLYENPDIVKVGQNIKYDLEVLRNYGVDELDHLLVYAMSKIDSIDHPVIGDLVCTGLDHDNLISC